MENFIGKFCPVLTNFQKENLIIPYSLKEIKSKEFSHRALSHSFLDHPVFKSSKPVVDIETSNRLANELFKNENKLFNNMQIVLDLSTTDEMKFKNMLRKKILDNGGQISYVVTKDSTFVICGDGEVSQARVNAANRYNIPVLTGPYIDNCLKEQKLLDVNPFLFVHKVKTKAFNQGKIMIPKVLCTMSTPRNIISVQLLPISRKCLEEYDILKSILFIGQCRSKQKNIGKLDSKPFRFATLEVHVQKEKQGSKSESTEKFCIFSHEGEMFGKGIVQETEKILGQFFARPDEALSAYSQLHNKLTGSPNFLSVSDDECLHPSIGSPAFQLLRKEWSYVATDIESEVLIFTKTIWNESINQVQSFLESGWMPLQWEVREAVSLLMQISITLSQGKQDLVNKLSSEFYRVIRFKQEYSEPLNTAINILRKLEICKTCMSLSILNEAKLNTYSIYRSLRCQVSIVPSASNEFQEVSNLVFSSQTSKAGLVLHNVYSVTRNLEEISFLNELPNHKFLFHGTSPSNLLGILVNGLAPPLSTVLKLNGLEPPEENLLGFGIYLSDSVAACLKFSHPSNEGYRFLLICKVALGNVYQTNEPHTTLVTAPNGFDSVCGLKTRNDNVSCFHENEYVIYQESQLKVRYIVQFSLAHQNVCNSLDKTPEIEPKENSEEHLMVYRLDDAITDYQEVLSDVCSLKQVNIASNMSTTNLSLECTHIRSSIVDLVAKVTVFQVYRNEQNSTIEVKYTFPLTEGAAVCGFEAFIGAKHIVGKVKEKQTAHTEYKEAVSQGHGAYLLDEERPDLFTASLGNLPPLTRAIIKITYITELSVDSDTLKLVFPASLHPSKSVVNIDQQVVLPPETKLSFEASIEMATNIQTISSPTHAIKVKKTDTKAVVKLSDDLNWKYGLIISIRMCEVHIPRMWIEEHPEKNSQVCMVSYYPEFDVGNYKKKDEIIILIDASNSMKGESFQTALTLSILCLKHISRDVKFNVLAFGTIFKELFPESQEFNAKTKKRAEEFLSTLLPDMGGNNVYAPLRSCDLLTKSQNLNIFLVSDGCFENENLLCNLISKLEHSRLFTLGTGDNCNTHFLKRLARYSGGPFAEFNFSNKRKWDKMVREHVLRVSQPSLTDIKIEWQQFDEDGDNLIVAPQKIKSLFSGGFLLAYGFVSNCTVATLKAKLEGQEYSTVVSSHQRSGNTSSIIHSLAAKACIVDWEEGIFDDETMLHIAQKENLKESIIAMAKSFNLVTSLTSFIAVEERNHGETINQDVSVEMLLKDCNIDILSCTAFEDDVLESDNIRILEEQSFVPNFTNLHSVNYKNKSMNRKYYCFPFQEDEPLMQTGIAETPDSPDREECRYRETSVVKHSEKSSLRGLENNSDFDFNAQMQKVVHLITRSVIKHGDEETISTMRKINFPVRRARSRKVSSPPLTEPSYQRSSPITACSMSAPKLFGQAQQSILSPASASPERFRTRYSAGKISLACAAKRSMKFHSSRNSSPPPAEATYDRSSPITACSMSVPKSFGQAQQSILPPAPAPLASFDMQYFACPPTFPPAPPPASFGFSSGAACYQPAYGFISSQKQQSTPEPLSAQEISFDSGIGGGGLRVSKAESLFKSLIALKEQKAEPWKVQEVLSFAFDDDVDEDDDLGMGLFDSDTVSLEQPLAKKVKTSQGNIVECLEAFEACCDDFSSSLSSDSDSYEFICDEIQEPDTSKIDMTFLTDFLSPREDISQYVKDKITFFIESLLKDLGGGLPLCGIIFKTLSLEAQNNLEIEKILQQDESKIIRDLCNSISRILKTGSGEIKLLDMFASFLKKLQNSGLRSMGTSIFKNITDLNLLLLLVYYFFLVYIIPAAVPEDALAIGFQNYKVVAKHIVKFLTSLKRFEDGTLSLGKAELECELSYDDLCLLILCLKRVHYIDKRYPLMYASLGIGSSWEGAVFQCIQEFL